MTSERYIAVLEGQIPAISAKIGPPTNWIFMDDNAPPHTSHATTRAKQEMGLRVMDWPSRSPDLNPIEHAWAWMKWHIRKQLRPSDDAAALCHHIHRAWRALPQAVLDTLIDSMTSRVLAVTVNRGGNTKY